MKLSIIVIDEAQTISTWGMISVLLSEESLI